MQTEGNLSPVGQCSSQPIQKFFAAQYPSGFQEEHFKVTLGKKNKRIETKVK